jgi:hypothetical protein
MQTQFYVSHSGHQMGPYEVSDILKLVTEGTLSPLDYVYDDAKADWVLFLEHPSLQEKVKALKPKAPPAPAAKHHEEPKKVEKHGHEEKVQEVAKNLKVTPEMAELMGHEWFVLKGENKFGPYSYVDVIKMLQQGVIFEFDFAWYQGLDGWKRIAEMSAFSKPNMKMLKETVLPEVSEAFFRRRYKRVQYGGTVLVHDNKSVWRGVGLEISEGGAGLMMENSMCVPGQQLYLHFKPGDGVPPFNAICEVVSKGFTGDVKNPKASIKYGVKFKTVSPEAHKFIADYTKRGKIAA